MFESPDAVTKIRESNVYVPGHFQSFGHLSEKPDLVMMNSVCFAHAYSLAGASG
jgi:hypothetical protein